MDKIIVGKSELCMILNTLRDDVADRGMVNRQEIIDMVTESIEDYSDYFGAIARERDEALVKLAAMESKAKQLITNACCTAVEKLTELAPNQGWDSGDVVAEMYIRQLSDKPVPADKPAPSHWAIDNPGRADQYRCESLAVRDYLGFPKESDEVSPRDLREAIQNLMKCKQATRITEQDAREIAKSALSFWRNTVNLTLDVWLKDHAPALLNKLNSDREQVPAATPSHRQQSAGLWNSIETAPKDGTEVIVRFAINEGGFVEVKNASFNGGWKRVCHTAGSVEYFSFGKITHWMPMPVLSADRCPSQQSSVADAERFCDSHCTWRGHNPDCPSHESEQ